MHVHDDQTEQPAPVLTIDGLVVELRRLRQEADSPSYAELATRISRSREATGEPAARARIARSTVYDVFRLGRRRLDVGLVREVLQAMGLDANAVTYWTAVAQRAVPDGPATDEPATEVVAEIPEPDAEPVDVLVAHPVPEPVVEHVPAADPEPLPAAVRRPSRLALVLVACVLGNLAGRVLADQLRLPLHLDMVWTAVSAILLGPWWGALVGVSTNGLGAFASGADSLPFALVNVTGALVWGYGVRRFAMGRTIPRFFALNVVCAVACSVVATPILLILFHGLHGPQTTGIGERLLAISHTVVVTVFLANLLISLADKMVCGFVALAVIEAQSPSRLSLDLLDHGEDQSWTGASPTTVGRASSCVADRSRSVMNRRHPGGRFPSARRATPA